MPSLIDDQVTTRILSRAPACPIVVMRTELIDTLYDFYEYTQLDRRTLASIPTVVNQATYPVTLPANTLLIEAKSVTVNKIPLQEKSADALDLEWGEISKSFSFSYRHDMAFSGLDEPTWRLATGTQPRYYHWETDGTIRLVAAPESVFTAEFGILIYAALKPNPASITTIDDALWNDNYQTIVAGTLQRLLSMPEKAWTNVELADYYGGQYSDGRDKKRDEIRRSNIRNDRQTYHSRCYA